MRFNMFGRSKEDDNAAIDGRQPSPAALMTHGLDGQQSDEAGEEVEMVSPAAASQRSFEPTPYNGKTFWQNLLPVMTCGAGLFSDGYINNVS